MSTRPGKPPLSDRELSSWKEIAEYLNVSIRTAQAWERGRGMPVHRVPGVRGVVTASAAALDTWKHSAGNSPASAPRLRFRAWYLACAVVLGVVLYLAFFHAGRPATWRVQENTLIVSDERGRELWRHVFPEPLEPDRYVQGQRNVWIGDLGDGHQSILFAIFSEPGRTALGRRKALAGVLALRGLAQLVLADLDGKSKIYLGGVNNARKQATLVVLDPDNFSGTSLEPPAFQLQDLRPGVEEARVFFPVTCMTRAIDSYNVVNELSVQPGRLTIDVHERAPVTPAVSPISVLYHLDGRLALQDARWADDFVPMHATLYQRGELDHALSAPEASLLRQVTIIRRPRLGLGGTPGARGATRWGSPPTPALPLPSISLAPMAAGDSSLAESPEAGSSRAREQFKQD